MVAKCTFWSHLAGRHPLFSGVSSRFSRQGLNEDTIRLISSKKNEPEWLLDFRLKAFRKWLTMEEPKWWGGSLLRGVRSAGQLRRSFPRAGRTTSTPSSISRTSPTMLSPRQGAGRLLLHPGGFNNLGCHPRRASLPSCSCPARLPCLLQIKEKKKSLDEVDPELLATFEKLGIPLNEQKRLANVAVDAVFDSVSIATTFREELSKAGVIFCSISEAVKEYPELVRK